MKALKKFLAEIQSSAAAIVSNFAHLWFLGPPGGGGMYVASHRIESWPSVREDPGYFYFNFESISTYSVKIISSHVSNYIFRCWRKFY
jgi:hypothetical protein